MFVSIAEGWMIDAKADSLLMQMRARWNKVPRKTVQAIRSASMAQLNAWLVRILDAQSIEEVMAEPAPKPRAKRRVAARSEHQASAEDCL